MRLLAIETSCDETGAAVVEGSSKHLKILSNVIGSQIKTHQKYGGVIPELAARRHTELIIPVVWQALAESVEDKTLVADRSHYNLPDLKDEILSSVDAIAVTNAPGLMIALLVGVETAKTLSYAWNKPLIGVNHLEAHIYSILGGPQLLDDSFLNSPGVALVVSGGHTELVLVEGYGQYQLLGRTRDDAAGEAFDKVAKILGLSYPGGPLLSRLAWRGKPDRFEMPRPMLDSRNFDFSFAGLKTHILYLVKRLKKVNQAQIADIAASFEEAITDILVAKTMAAALYYQTKSVIVTGGVSANSRLRYKIKEAAKIEKLNCYLPPLALTGDNAAMIGIAGYLKLKYTGYDDPFTLKADPNLKFYS